MAITLVGNAVKRESTAVTSTTPTLPAGIASGDVMVLNLGAKDGTRTITSGLEAWTLVGHYMDSTSTSADAWLYLKVAGSSEVAPTINFSASGVCVTSISAWRGVDTSTPQDVVAATAYTGIGTSVTAPSLTTVTGGAFVITSCACDDAASDGPISASGAGTTEIYMDDGGLVGITAHYQTIASAGASNEVTYSIIANETIAAISIALRPASGPQGIRKGGTATFDKPSGIGTITGVTLNGNAITLDSQTVDDFTVTDSDGTIAASGAYDLVATGSTTETISVQVNVVGLASFNINKDGADQGNLTDVEFIILTGAAGSRAINQQTIGVTTTASGDTGAIEVTDTALNVGDAVVVVQQSVTVGGGIAHSATLGAI